ncbi:2002_t:CDS:2, partial [Scutellospora calospora]
MSVRYKFTTIDPAICPPLLTFLFLKTSKRHLCIPKCHNPNIGDTTEVDGGGACFRILIQGMISKGLKVRLQFHFWISYK